MRAPQIAFPQLVQDFFLRRLIDRRQRQSHLNVGGHLLWQRLSGHCLGS
jgi:hypothetical protein